MAPVSRAPPISIVLPVLNEAERLPGLLARLRAQFHDSELIVVDGGSRDRSVGAALPAADAVLMSEAGRARQMNIGAAAARGDWLFFLHADCEPDFTQAELFEAVDERDATAGRGGAAEDGQIDWAFFRVRLLGRSRALPMIAWFMNHRSRLTGVATGDQGLLVRRKLFAALGGFAAIPLMEDVEICKRLRRVSRPFTPAAVISSSGRRWEEQGVVATVLRMWLLRLAYWSGVSPQRLWQHYYGRRALQQPGVPPRRDPDAGAG